MNSQTPNLKLQTSKESIIAKLRGRLKLDQQTAAEILESPEIEYELSDIPERQLRQLTKAAADMAIQQKRVAR
ncbi:MAG: hypothetical protein H8E47_11980 [Anaerolineales bacterium]|nr:hypothetical protein [Anaerolineales bacterium]